jgi:hypothetical protein
VCIRMSPPIPKYQNRDKGPEENAGDEELGGGDKRKLVTTWNGVLERVQGCRRGVEAVTLGDVVRTFGFLEDGFLSPKV